MLDAMLAYQTVARQKSDALKRFGLMSGKYALVTVHRSANTDDSTRLRQIVSILNQANEPVVFPVHPRTRDALDRLKVQFHPHVKLAEPFSYFDMLNLEANARLIATDSGGVQREAYFLGIPCLTLRDQTEWTETVDAGWNKLVGTDPDRVVEAWHSFTPPSERPPIFGDGTAARRILAVLDSAA